MAKKRKFVAYRRLERPYTRKSKYREKSFIRASPPPRIIRYNMGNPHLNAKYTLFMVSDKNLQIRDAALESARLIINRHCEKHFGRQGFYMRLRVYPHHHLRENALASGAGADRLSTGMKCSFGKVIGVAAQIRKGQELIELHVDEAKLARAKKIMRMACSKLPCSPNIVVVENEVKVLTEEEQEQLDAYNAKAAAQDAANDAKAAEKAESEAEVKTEAEPAKAAE